MVLAERRGFEPRVGLHPQTLSRRPPSTTRPPLRICFQSHAPKLSFCRAAMILRYIGSYFNALLQKTG